MIPWHCADEVLQDLALDLDERRDVLGILPGQVGQQSLEVEVHVALAGLGLQNVLIDLLYLLFLTPVTSHNILLLQLLPNSIPYRQDNVRRRKDAHRVGTAARGSIERRSYWIPGSWNVRMVYTDAIPCPDPRQESNGADQYQEFDR